MQPVELIIDKVVWGGQGIGRVGKTVVFVPLSAPGDRLKVRITDRKRNYWQGEIDGILEASPLRIQPKCEYYGTCGGCDLQHLNYEAQLVVKKLIVNESLQRIGRTFVPPGNPLHTATPWHYRNKAQFPVARDGRSRADAGTERARSPWRIGFFERNSHRLVDIARCPVQPTALDRLLADLRTRLEQSPETAYDEQRRTGNLRHIVLKHGAATNEMALIFVSAQKRLASELHESLPQSHAGLVSVVQNHNPHPTNRILAEKASTLAGEPFYHDRLLGKTLRVSTDSFFQANTAAAELLVKRILKYLEPDGGKTVLDLFSGVGTISLPIAGFVGRVIGIEMNRSAASDAQENARANDIRNVEFIPATAEEGIRQVKHADAVVLDPPRKGCSQELLHRVAELKPSEIIYVSCNPTTLARDLARLRSSGYEAVEVQLIDMFPQTSHVETVAKLKPEANHE